MYNIDFAELEQKLMSMFAKHDKKFVILGRQQGKTNLFDLYNQIFSDELNMSSLESMLLKNIDSYWSLDRAIALRATLIAQQRNQHNPAIFKSESTKHMFPWYHRKRKY